jgi:hypothetical protein
MPGGMKIGIDGKTYGFTTDLCSGGIFLKKPTELDFMCTHGYFLRRPNGCRMHSNDVVSGSNYVCTDGDQIKKSIQAFIPLTNPTSPLEHTLAFANDADALASFRRYTYSQGLESQYTEETLEGASVVIVSNAQKTPSISIGNMCYEGKQSHGAAYVAKLPQELKDGDSEGFFTRTCSAKSVFFPWSKAHHYHFTEGYSSQLEFKNEISANLPAETMLKANEDRLDVSHFEIWNGLAYCLQARHVEGANGKKTMNGIHPSISTLKPLCHNHKEHSRKTRAVQPFEIKEGSALARVARANAKKHMSGKSVHGHNGTGRRATKNKDDEKPEPSEEESDEGADPPESALLGCVMSCNGQAMNKIPPMFAARQFSLG